MNLISPSMAFCFPMHKPQKSMPTLPRAISVGMPNTVKFYAVLHYFRHMIVRGPHIGTHVHAITLVCLWPRGEQVLFSGVGNVYCELLCQQGQPRYSVTPVLSNLFTLHPSVVFPEEIVSDCTDVRNIIWMVLKVQSKMRLRGWIGM